MPKSYKFNNNRWILVPDATVHTGVVKNRERVEINRLRKLNESLIQALIISTSIGQIALAETAMLNESRIRSERNHQDALDRIDELNELLDDEDDSSETSSIDYSDEF